MKTTIRALLLATLPNEVTDLMARYCAAERYSYKRLLEGRTALDVEKAVAEQFSLNSRYAKDAVFEAGALIVAQRELVKLRWCEWEKRLKAATEKLKKAKSAVKQARLKAKVARRQRKLAFWQRYKEAGTHPPVVFGGKRAFRDRCSGKISQSEWREGRSHRLLSRGDKTKGGNLNLRLVPGALCGDFLEIAVPGQGRMAPRCVVPVYLPRKVSKQTGMVNGTDWRSMVLAYLAWTCGAALVIEDLKFLDDREVGAKFNRMAHQFVYRELLQAIERRALRHAVPIVKVHPAYTSVIGALKYAHQYQLGIHQASLIGGATTAWAVGNIVMYRKSGSFLRTRNGVTKSEGLAVYLWWIIPGMFVIWLTLSWSVLLAAFSMVVFLGSHLYYRQHRCVLCPLTCPFQPDPSKRYKNAT
ncbi:MAG: hypothetical protein M1553_06820 [Firmicutes bacterium]|nr:hypothetical protein [Bacillota bacterium]